MAGNVSYYKNYTLCYSIKCKKKLWNDYLKNEVKLRKVWKGNQNPLIKEVHMKIENYYNTADWQDMKVSRGCSDIF